MKFLPFKVINCQDVERTERIKVTTYEAAELWSEQLDSCIRQRGSGREVAENWSSVYR